MKQLVRRIGQTVALTLPVILVTTGTLAVTHVPWAATQNDQQVVAAASGDGSIGRTATTADTKGMAKPDALRAEVMEELRQHDPGTALELLGQKMQEDPSLTPYCTELANDLGRAAVHKYHGDVQKARSFARPVCDGSFAAGVVAQ